MLAKKSRRSTTEKAKKISFAEEWFDQLKCANDDRIDPSGVLKLCEEIGRLIYSEGFTDTRNKPAQIKADLKADQNLIETSPRPDSLPMSHRHVLWMFIGTLNSTVGGERKIFI